MLPEKSFAYSLFRVYVTFLFYTTGIVTAITLQLTLSLFDLDFFTAVICSILSVFFIRFIIRVFIPTIKQKYALTIDEEKIYYRVDNKTVYWSDVVFIVKRWSSSNKSTYIAFELMDTNKEVHMDPSFLIAEEDEVYKTIQQYFEASLIADGQLGYTANNDDA